MKKIKYIVIAAVILVASFLYAHIDKKMPIFDKTVETTEYGNTGEISSYWDVTQVFTCKKEVLDGLSVQVSLLGHNAAKDVRYNLWDKETGESIRDGTFSTTELKDGRFYTFGFPQVKDVKGKELAVSFSMVNTEPGEGIAINTVPDKKGGQQLVTGGQGQDGSVLAMRTISKLFDVETFITVAICIAFLAFFISILFRFFS